jgi:hypothetical protein
MHKLEFFELKKGLRVQDEDGYVGIITKCDDIHNIVVNLQCGTGGYTFYCIDPSCKITKHYESLYSVDESI